MQAVVCIVLYFGTISVYAAPETKDEKTYNVAVKRVNVGLIQMDVNTICRAAGYVTPAELESFKLSGVVSDSTKPTLKEITKPITDKYDSTTSKNSSVTEKYFSIDPRTGKNGTTETVTATSTNIETITAGKDRSIATIAYVSTSSDKEATKTKFLSYASEYNASIAAEEKGFTKEITIITEKEHTATPNHTYTSTRIEDVIFTTEVPRSTKIVDKLVHDSASSGRTTRDTKEATEKRTSTPTDAGLSETTEKLIGISTLSSDLSTSIATTRDERSTATDAHTGSTADFDDSSLTTKESEKSSVALSTTVKDEPTHISVAKVNSTLASPAAERTTTEPSSNSSTTVTEDERRTSPASGTPADGHDTPPVEVVSTTILDKSSTTESEKSSTTLKGGDKTASDDKSLTEEHTYTTVAKEDTMSSVHKKEVSVETVTSEYHDRTTTSGEKLKPKESSTTEAASSTPTTTERNNGSSTDKIRLDRGKKVDYSVYGYLALSLLIAAIIIWISYVIYTRHQSNSYVLPATAAEATPLNHITTTT